MPPFAVFLSFRWKIRRFFDVLNHSADKVNEIHKNVHSMAKRQGAAVMSLPYVIPLVLPIVILVLAVVYFLKKPLLRREAGKLSQRWRLETDVNTTVQFASEDIKKNNGASAKR